MMALEWRIPPRTLDLVWRVVGAPFRPPVQALSRLPGVLIGPPGRGGNTVQIDQTSPAGTWILTHGLGRRPMVQVFLVSGEQVVPDVATTDTQVTVTFATPTAGYVVLS